MKNWLEPQEMSVPEPLRSAVGGHPLVAQALVRRGITEAAAAQAFLDPGAYTPASPFELPGMQAAVDRLLRAIRLGEQVCVWGDFDVDGQTATALLVSLLRQLGGQVSYHVPVRAVESHGVSLPALEQVLAGGVQVLLTCDTGITAHPAVDYALSRGVDVIITDHHDLPVSPAGEPAPLPQANAVVNPKLLPPGHPLTTLPGVGVAYKLAEALCESAGAGESGEHLDLVALGIVADIALLRGEVRYLLQRGLKALRGTPRPGLRAIMEYAGLQPAALTEDHIGYEIAPRLNALGRLGDANPAVELLITQDTERAGVLALELEGLNARRKLLTSQVFQGALAQIEQDPSLLEAAALVLAHPAWEAGVIGIVAGQLAERYRRPVILIAAPEGELGRGSARSVEGVNINAAIAAQGDLLRSFGGHPMAAGLSIEPGRIPEFRRRLSRAVAATLGEIPGEATLPIDGYLPLGELTLELVADLERLAPFGAGNPPLTLACRGLTLSSVATVGRSQEHLLLVVEDEGGETYRVVWWQGAGWTLPEGRFDLAYTARASSYRGVRDVQIEWLDARPQAEQPAELISQRPPIEVVDYRGQAHPLAILQRLLAEGDVQVWREAEATGILDGHDRFELQPSESLAIWTAPPSPAELRHALEKVSPQKIYLFGVLPEAGSPEAFLQRLAGLLKHALKASQGHASLSALAAATAQRRATVRLGLDWLAARGHIRVVSEDVNEIVIAAGDGIRGEDLAEREAQLKAALAETAAYRAYFQKADKDSLVEDLTALRSDEDLPL
jgi:single-stranded-DNA-specific exonuclease